MTHSIPKRSGVHHLPRWALARSGKSPLLFLFTLALLTFPFSDKASSHPLNTGYGEDVGRPVFSFSYFLEQKRSKGEIDNVERKALEGGAWVRVARPVGLWARVRASGPWEGSESAWGLTDLEFGTCALSGNKWGRLDLDGWLAVIAPAGEPPNGGIWYQGMKAWSVGVEAKAAARILGRPESTPIWMGIEIRYRGSGRSGWVYLPHHSVAIADTVGWSKGGVLSWEASLRLEVERAALSTALLWEEPLGAGEIMVFRERPIYLIQRAAVKTWRSVNLIVSGEVLLSGDDPTTAFTAVSVAPRWSAGVALRWAFPM